MFSPLVNSKTFIESTPEPRKRSFHRLFDSNPENKLSTSAQAKRINQNLKGLDTPTREFIVKSVKTGNNSPGVSSTKSDSMSKAFSFSDQVASTSIGSWGSDIENSPASQTGVPIKQRLKMDNLHRDLRRSRMQSIMRKNLLDTPSPEDQIRTISKFSPGQTWYNKPPSIDFPSSFQPIKTEPDMPSRKCSGDVMDTLTGLSLRLPSVNSKQSFSRDKDLAKVKFYPYIRSYEKTRRDPPGRMDATLTAVKGRIYLFGGSLSSNDGDPDPLMVYNPEKGTWKVPECQGHVPSKTRIGHSAVVIKSNIYIFGGESENSLNNDVLVFYPHIKRWAKMDFDETNGTIISSRKHHAACVYENLMVVYGGIDHKENYLNDFWVFDTSNFSKLV